jgi:hypothetical protein
LHCTQAMRIQLFQTSYEVGESKGEFGYGI